MHYRKYLKLIQFSSLPLGTGFFLALGPPPRILAVSRHADFLPWVPVVPRHPPFLGFGGLKKEPAKESPGFVLLHYLIGEVEFHKKNDFFERAGYFCWHGIHIQFIFGHP